MIIYIETYSIPEMELISRRQCDMETLSMTIKVLFQAGLQKAVFTYKNRYILYFIEALK